MWRQEIQEKRWMGISRGVHGVNSLQARTATDTHFLRFFVCPPLACERRQCCDRLSVLGLDSKRPPATVRRGKVLESVCSEKVKNTPPSPHAYLSLQLFELVG